MSGEIFFNFDVKPIKKRKSQMKSADNKEEDISLAEKRGERKKYQNGKLDEGIWKRIDYAKANAVDTMGFYGSSKQNETEHMAIRRKPRSVRKSRKKSRHRQKIRGKEKEKRHEKDEEDQISLSDDNDDTSEENDKERRKQKKKTKRSHEPSAAFDIDIDKKGSRYRSKMKKKHRPLMIRHKDSENENADEADVELRKQATNISPTSSKLPSQSFSPEFTEENMKTASCASSTEAVMPEDDVDDAKPSISYETMYGDVSRSKYFGMELSVELRYWIVLAVFICLLIIYRSFLPPVQCDTEFQ